MGVLAQIPVCHPPFPHSRRQRRRLQSRRHAAAGVLPEPLSDPPPPHRRCHPATMTRFSVEMDDVPLHTGAFVLALFDS